jgi:hypothetical protein
MKLTTSVGLIDDDGISEASNVGWPDSDGVGVTELGK